MMSLSFPVTGGTFIVAEFYQTEFGMIFQWKTARSSMRVLFLSITVKSRKP